MSVTGSRRPAGTRLADAGTTLIEALVVVGIMSLVVMISFPRLQQNMVTLVRRQAATAVVERLREAHATALLKDQPVVFSVADNGRLYGWRGSTARTNAGVYVRSANGPIAFYGDGTSSGGVVSITSARRSYLVGVDPGNGAIGVVRR
jgi:type II secretory pathway pseudopilin PulG